MLRRLNDLGVAWIAPKTGVALAGDAEVSQLLLFPIYGKVHIFFLEQVRNDLGVEGINAVKLVCYFVGCLPRESSNCGTAIGHSLRPAFAGNQSAGFAGYDNHRIGVG